MKRPVSLILLLTGYPVAAAVLVRARAVLRERRTRWFVALEAATSAVAAGLALRGRRVPAALNAGAVVGFAVVWWWAGRAQES